jgi:plastocyanin
MKLKKEGDIVIMLAFTLFLILGTYNATKKEPIKEINILEDVNTISSNQKYDDKIQIPIKEKPKEAIIESPAVVKKEQNFKIIEIKDTKFTPKEINITVGTLVYWVNNDDKRNYRIYERSANQKFNSLQIKPHESFNYTFNNKGTYHFNDAIFTFMSGTIHVE